MRFDDSLTTVLSADRRAGHGADAAWRQLVDLIGRRRAEADAEAIGRLVELRAVVPAGVRAASARSLAFAEPPIALVAFFADDDLAVAAPVLRTASLPDADWCALLPTLDPARRSVLRQRRDLSDPVVRALESFGPVDFRLTDDRPVAMEPAAPIEPVAPAPPSSSFVALGDIPVVSNLRRQAEAEVESAPNPNFEIADLVARIERFTRDRPEPDEVPAPRDPAISFATDADGMIVMAHGAARGALLGASLASDRAQGLVRFDGGVAGAWRHRNPIRNARLAIAGEAEDAGEWRVSAMPGFDPASGRFIGYRGEARRPRADEVPAPAHPTPSRGADQLRQLVHELRTPANAIAGFSELIGSQLLGPVPEPYLDRARTIHTRAGALIDAIDDLDTAARIDSGALALRDEVVAIGPLLDRLASDLMPLGAIRGARLAIAPIGGAFIRADARAAERLLGRLLAAVLGTSSRGEAIGVDVRGGREQVAITVDRPAALATVEGDALFAIDDEQAGEGAPLLGTGFALRLVRNLAAELGGVLAIGPARLTLRLPAASDRPMEQAQTS